MQCSGPIHSPTSPWTWVFLGRPTEEMAKKRAKPLKNGNCHTGPSASRPSCLLYRRWSASKHTAREQALLACTHSLSTSPKTIFKIPTSWAQVFPWQSISVYAICPLWPWLPSCILKRAFSTISTQGIFNSNGSCLNWEWKLPEPSRRETDWESWCPN